MSLCLGELDSIILELNRIASRRRFMRERLVQIGHQLDYVADWVAYCHEKEKLLPKLHLCCVIQKLKADLKGVIYYKKFMREALWHVLERIVFVEYTLCDEDDECR